MKFKQIFTMKSKQRVINTDVKEGKHSTRQMQANAFLFYAGYT